MNRMFSLSLSFLLVAVGLSAGVEASPGVSKVAPREKRASRTIEVRYESGAIPYVVCFDCPYVTSRPGERFVSVEVIDDVSPLASVDVTWGTSSSGGHGYFGVCGKTEKPRRIPPSSQLTLYPWMVPGNPWLDDPAGACTHGFSTSGTIKITFMSHPRR